MSKSDAVVGRVRDRGHVVVAPRSDLLDTVRCAKSSRGHEAKVDNEKLMLEAQVEGVGLLLSRTHALIELEQIITSLTGGV